MVDAAGRSILNFDQGIARILTQEPTTAHTVLDRRKVTPSEAGSARMIDRVINARNIGADLQRALMPKLSDKKTLQPHVFDAALGAAARALKDAAAKADNPDDAKVLAAMTAVLDEHGDLQETLNYFRNMLIAG